MRKRSFFIGASILAIGGFLAKVLGAFYKIPLTHILGANGMGIYYLVFPFYSLALILSSSGLSVAVSKLVATERGKFHRKNELKIFKYAIILAIIISIILMIFTIALAETFSFLQGNSNAYLSYLAIAPAIIFASIVSVIKGYFQGVENMMPSSVSLLVQQLFRLIFGLLFAYSLVGYGLTYAVLGAILGLTLSEFCAMVYLIIRYIIYKKKQFYNFFEKRKVEGLEKKKKLIKKLIEGGKGYLVSSKNLKKTSSNLSVLKYYCNNLDCVSSKEVFVKLIKYAIPSTLSNLVLPLAVFIDSFLVVNLLVNSGFTTSVATSLYGLSNGIVSSLISLPTVIISAISTSIVPNLSSSIELNSREVVVTKTNFFIKFAWIIALPIFIVFLLFSPEIIELLYAGGLSNKVIDEFTFAYKILAVSSVTIIYNAFLYTFTAILNAFDKPQIPFYSQLVGLVFRILLTFALVSIPSLNVFGLIIANLVFLTISCLGCVIKLKDIIHLRFSVRSFLIAPIVSTAVVGVVGYVLKRLCATHFPAWLEMILIGGLMLLIYIVLLFALRVFTVKEWGYLPIPKGLKKFLPKKVKSALEIKTEITE